MGTFILRARALVSASLLTLLVDGCGGVVGPRTGVRSDSGGRVAKLCTDAPASILFCDDFESGAAAADWTYRTGYAYSSTIQSQYVRSGQYAHKTMLIRADTAGWSPQRAELVLEDERTGMLGDTRWYAFSVFIPNDYIADESINPEIIFQLLMHPYLNDKQKSPQLAFQIRGDNLQIENRHSVGNNVNDTVVDRIYEQPLTGFRNRWTDWVLFATWSTGSDGVLKVWRDGALVVNRSGANAYAGTGDRIFEFKFGVYKWSWDMPERPTLVGERVIYHDSFRIGDATATYDDMRP